MSRRFICSNGHEWEPSASAHSLTAHLDPLCPVCGAAAQLSTGDKGDAATEPVAHIPRAATVEAAAPKFAAPSASPAPERTEASRAASSAPLQQESIPPAPRLAVPRDTWTSEPADDQGPWHRRHPAAAVLIATGCLVVVAALVAALLGFRSAGRGWDAAEKERLRVEQLTREADGLRAERTAAQTKAGQLALEEGKARKHAQHEREEADRQREEARQQAERAEQARKEAIQLRDQEAAARATAREQTKSAEQSRLDALRKRDEMATRLVQLYSAGGVRRVESGDLLGSLPWLVEALQMAQGDPQREQPHRLRIAAVLEQCPRPVQAWFHNRQYTHAQLSPDGRRLATAGRDGMARLWIVITGEAVGEVMKHEAPVVRVLYNPDGQQLLTLAANGTVHLWEAATGKALLSLDYEGELGDVAWSPDGLRLLTVGQPMREAVIEVQVWDAVKGEAIGKPLKHSRPVSQASFSPDGRHVLTASADRTARLWSVEKSEQVGPALQHADAVVRAEFSSDGRRVLTATADGAARVWDAATFRPISPSFRHSAAVNRASFSPDGRQVLTAGADQTVRLWDAAAGTLLQILKHGDTLAEAEFSMDGRYVFIAGGDAPARLCGTSTGDLAMPPLPHGGRVRLAASSSDGRRVLLMGDQAVVLWDLAAGEPPAPVARQTESADHSWYSTDGRLVLRATAATAQIHDANKRQPIGSALKHRYEVIHAAFSPDGRRALTVSQKGKDTSAVADVHLWDTANGEAVGQVMNHLTAVGHAVFSPDGRLVLTLGADKTVRVWNAVSGRPAGKDLDHKEPVTHAVFSPDGKQVLTATEDGTAWLWTVDTGLKLGQPMKHQGPISYVTFGPEGKHILTASLDTMAAVWDAATGTPVTKTYMKHDAPVFHAAFNADGSRVVTASQDRTARVWDPLTGKPLTPPLKHDRAVTLAVFSPDGRWVATAAANLVRVWDAVTGDPVSPNLKHTQGQTVTHISFSKEGRLVTATGDPGDPRARWTWNLAGEKRPLSDLLALAQLLAGRKLDATGAEVVAEAEELRAAWRDLPPKHPRDFASPPERALAWHRRGAEECERQQLWHGAVVHLDHLIEAESPQWELHARRGRALGEAGRWDRALSDYRKAIDLNPSRWQLYSSLARVLGERGQWEEAVVAYSRALEIRVNDRDLLSRRAQALAEQAKWDLAAADFSKAIDLGTSDAEVWRQYALVRLGMGDVENYRKMCMRLVRRHGDSPDHSVGRTVAWTCALTAEAVSDLKPLLLVAESGAAANPNSRPYQLTLAALLYRSGQYEPAVQRLQAAMKLPDLKGNAFELLFLAMAHHRLGQTGEAKKWLDQAIQEIDRITPKDPKVRMLLWDQRLELQLLRREAEALVLGKPPAPPK